MPCHDMVQFSVVDVVSVILLLLFFCRIENKVIVFVLLLSFLYNIITRFIMYTNCAAVASYVENDGGKYDDVVVVVVFVFIWHFSTVTVDRIISLSSILLYFAIEIYFLFSFRCIVWHLNGSIYAANGVCTVHGLLTIGRTLFNKENLKHIGAEN